MPPLRHRHTHWLLGLVSSSARLLRPCKIVGKSVNTRMTLQLAC